MSGRSGCTHADPHGRTNWELTPKGEAALLSLPEQIERAAGRRTRYVPVLPAALAVRAEGEAALQALTEGAAA